MFALLNRLSPLLAFSTTAFLGAIGVLAVTIPLTILCARLAFAPREKVMEYAYLIGTENLIVARIVCVVAGLFMLGGTIVCAVGIYFWLVDKQCEL